ncbi:SdrD B-like domain-containing protein [Corynebacterium diphtheriae]|uniref:SdrD B-like domain-containing protein n=1 Tax=Corynebacterium diphtheriae TaxID=1717 RepID=UPI0013C64C2A|nr:Cna B-type domain-containing protein [Corynebacterium diphtheriae bv. gravis]CAB0524615.1 Cna B-type domain-containing protein [Corynebacterium diphtheriae]CAB0871576.1 Cna B-type domain-containing protein [Corynebacterium diphtheriae]CAB0967840.1 Cna B-type domain-containing protein [Corynebacterium diphtheriae]
MGNRPGRRIVAVTTAATLAISGLTVTAPSAFSAVDDGTTNAFTSNPDAKFANEIFFFDFSKVASGDELQNTWQADNPENNEGGFGGKRIKEGDSYTYKEVDGLPKGMEVTVTIKSIKAIYPDAQSSNGTPLTVENGGIWARNVTWNDFFRPLDFDALAGRNSERDKWFDRGVLYPSDPGAKWQISQYLDPALFGNKADSVGNQGYTFDLDIKGTLNGKPISLDVIASDGESTGIRVEDHQNPYGKNLPKGGVPENLGLVTNADGGWQVIQDLVNKEGRYYYVDNTPTVPSVVPEGKDPYPQIDVKPGDEWSLQNGDKTYGWVDTELNEGGGEWKSIPQSQPLLVSRGAKTVSVTLDNHPRGKTGSRQGVVAGIFIPTDQGDAPKSYGEASHILDNWNVTGQPKQNPDVAFEAKNRVGENMPTRDGGQNWSDDAKKDSEEDVQPSAFKDGFEKSNGKVTFPVTAKDSEVVAWVDLDSNGTFDESERRIGVVKDGSVTFDWSDAANKPEPGKDYYARIRVGGEGVKAEDMKQPTGVVQGGEVEDLKFTFEKKPETLVSLGDKVWFDQDSDGLQTDGEPGVKNVKVSLLDEQGKPVNEPGTEKPYEITTGDNGEYLFENLPKGKYKVQFDYSAARTSDDKPFTAFTVPGPGVDGKTEKDSDVLDSKNGNIGLTDVIDLQSDRRDVDAGLVVVSITPAVSVGDLVWHDKNGDGIQNDGDDSGISGVELKILDPEGNPAKNIDGQLVANVVTDNKGKYLFENLPVLKDGQSYTVEVVKNPEGFVSTKSGATDADKDSSTKSVQTAPGTLTKDGAQDLTLDFGFVKLGSLSGMTWFDSNKDGVRDDSEKPRAGVTVTLLKDGKPVEGVEPVQTGEDGSYKFENLVPGTGYSVRFGDKENLTKKTEGDVTKDKDSNADLTTGETATAEVKAGENTPNLDAGYIFEPETKNSVTVAHQGETQKSTDNDSEKFGNITDAGITPAEMFPGVDPTLPVEYKLVDASGDPTDKVEVPGQGTYTVDSDGVVTFEPHPDFVGTAKTVVVTAIQGEVTHAAHYTPIVIPKESNGEFPLPHFVDKGVTGEPVTVTPGKGNHPDYPADLLRETVKFVEGDQPEGAEISEHGKKITVPGQGVWTIDENGNFTFTPEPDFVGSPDTVKYNGEDADGKPGTNNGTVTITYPVPEGDNDLIRNFVIAGGVIGGVGLLAALVSGNSNGSSNAPAPAPTTVPNPAGLSAEPKVEPTKVKPREEEKKPPMLATTGASIIGLLVAALLLVLAGATLVARRKNK